MAAARHGVQGRAQGHGQSRHGSGRGQPEGRYAHGHEQLGIDQYQTTSHSYSVVGDSQHQQYHQPRIGYALASDGDQFLDQDLGPAFESTSDQTQHQQPYSPQLPRPSPPAIQTSHLPSSSNPRFSYTQTPLHTQARPQYTIVDSTTSAAAAAGSSSSSTPIDGSSPTSDRTGSGTGTSTQFSALTGSLQSWRSDMSPIVPSPAAAAALEGAGPRATYSLYPRDRPERTLTPGGTAVAMNSPERRAQQKSAVAPKYTSNGSPGKHDGGGPGVVKPLRELRPELRQQQAQTQLQQQQSNVPPNALRLDNIHPAHFAPYAEISASTPPPSSPERTRSPGQPQPQRYPSPLQKYQHQRSTSGPPLRVNTITGSSSLEKTPPQPSTNHAQFYSYAVPPIPGDAKEPVTPNMSTPHLTPRTPTYNPHSLAGPNIDESLHLPGQISHPNSSITPEWKHGLCGADLLCIESCFCPCMVYGKVQYRLSQRAARKEATDLLGYNAFNGNCGIMALACGFQWILTLIQRTRLRKEYSIDGAVFSDCGTAVCCGPCTLAQHEREIRDREAARRQFAGPASGVAVPYMGSREDMRYAAPPR